MDMSKMKQIFRGITAFKLLQIFVLSIWDGWILSIASIIMWMMGGCIGFLIVGVIFAVIMYYLNKEAYNDLIKNLRDDSIEYL